MSRLVLSSVLVALVAGLTLLACVPIEDELLPNIGDEMRITNDPEPNYDPCWLSYDYGWPREHPFINTAELAWHDRHSVFLYSMEDRSTEELYTAPAGFEITALFHRAIALYDGTTAQVIYRPERGETELWYEDEGPEIESFGGNSQIMLMARADGNLHYYIYQHEEDDLTGILCDGFDVFAEEYGMFDYVSGSDIETIVYRVSIGEHDGELNVETEIILDNGYYNRYPNGKTCLSNVNGDMDIWDFYNNVQITNKPGAETQLEVEGEYVLFNRIEDGRSDIYVVRK